MQFGASTFIWVSPFSNRTLDLMDHAKAMGFDLLEIWVEDPGTIDVPAIRAKAEETKIGVTICGAFGGSRNLSAEEDAVRAAGLDYLKRCIDFAEALGSPFVSGPMYSAVGLRNSSKRSLVDGSGTAPSRRCASPRSTPAIGRSSSRSSPSTASRPTSSTRSTRA